MLHFINKVTKPTKYALAAMLMLAIQVLPLTVFMVEQAAAANSPASVPFSDSFGSSDVNNVTNWDDDDGSGSGTRIEGSSSARPGSPTTGHARIGDDGWICRTVNASDYEDLTLSYYFRGSSDTEDSDDLIVEYRTNGNCNSNGGWSSIDSKELGNNSWSNQQTKNLPSVLDDDSFYLRFRTSTSQSSEEAWVDDVSVTGEKIETLPPVTPNPSLAQACGLDIALVLDDSQSITTGQRTQMKAALKQFTAALNGTPTQFSVTRFGNSANVMQSFTSNVATVDNAIDSFPASPSGQYTNWEAGIQTAQGTFAGGTSNPNLMIFATDGDPTASTAGSNGPVSETGYVLHLPPAVTAANNAKSAGTRMLALGIGTPTVSRLQAISGNTVNGSVLTADVITSSFDTLAAELAAFAEETCGGTVTTTKLIDHDHDPQTPAVPASNWNFDVAGSSETTDANGKTDAVEVDPGTYSVTETVKDGYQIQSAICKNSEGGNLGQFNPQTNAVEGIEVGPTVIVSCTFVNEEIPTASLKVVKYAINDNGGTIKARDFDIFLNGNSLGDADSSTNNHPNSSASYNDIELTPGVEYEVSETLPNGYKNEFIKCYDVTSGTDDAPMISHPFTAEAGKDYLCKIQNNDKAPKLTVTKLVKDNHKWNGNLKVSDFPLYVDFQGVVSGQAVELSTGWHIVGEIQQPGYELVGVDGDCFMVHGFIKVHLSLGQELVCTLINKAKPGSITLYKHVINDNGGQKDSEDFKLNIGFKGDVDQGERNYLPAGIHWIWETKDKGYELKEIKCYDGNKKVNPHYTFNDGSIKVNLKLDQHLKCWIVNDDIPPKVTVKKVTYPHFTKEEFDFEIDKVFYPDFFDYHFDLGSFESYTSGPQMLATLIDVREEQKQGWTQTDATCYEKNKWGHWEDMHTTKFWTENGKEYKCIFTNEKNGEIDGYKWSDNNGNGWRDEGETKLEGWTIELYKKVCGPSQPEDDYPDQALSILSIRNDNYISPIFECEYELEDTTITDEFGRYSFGNLEYGKYKVCEEQTQLSQGDGWTQTFPSTDWFGGCHKVEVNRHTRNHSHKNFGNAPHLLSIEATPMCINHFPYLSWVVTPTNFTPTQFTLDWLTMADNEAGDPAGMLVDTQTYIISDPEVTDNGDGTYSGLSLWPGTNDNPVTPDWPGWKKVDGEWVQDPSDFGGNLKPDASIKFTVNPEQTVDGISYPVDGGNCNPPTVGQVLGDSTLVNTGSSTLIASVLAVALIGTAGSVTLIQRKTSR